MTTATTRPPAAGVATRRPVLRSGRLPFLLTIGLALAATLGAGLSLFRPDLLSGASVTQGNLRGTAVVVLLVGVPLLLVAAVRSRRGSARWLVAWLAAAGYLTYQAMLFCFATPFNPLFLVYDAHLGFGIWTLLSLAWRVDLAAFGDRVDERLPGRFLGAVLVTLAALNGLAWLARIVPAVGSERPTSVLAGSGLMTSAVWVQDLAFWIPASVVAGMGLWQHRSAGIAYGGALLTFFAVESASIASDQWWGARADASHPALASSGAVPTFLLAAAVVAVPLRWLFRNLDR